MSQYFFWCALDQGYLSLDKTAPPPHLGFTSMLVSCFIWGSYVTSYTRHIHHPEHMRVPAAALCTALYILTCARSLYPDMRSLAHINDVIRYGVSIGV